MKNKTYLKNKGAAKLLFDLYSEVYCRSGNKDLSLPMEVDKETIQKYMQNCPCVTLEEIWVYSKNKIYISDQFFINQLDKVRERIVDKNKFIYMFISPTYNFFLRNFLECISIYDLQNYAFQNGLMKDVTENMQEWLTFEQEILLADAEKIVENIKEFLAR